MKVMNSFYPHVMLTSHHITSLSIRASFDLDSLFESPGSWAHCLTVIVTCHLPLSSTEKAVSGRHQPHVNMPLHVHHGACHKSWRDPGVFIEN